MAGFRGVYWYDLLALMAGAAFVAQFVPSLWPAMVINFITGVLYSHLVIVPRYRNR